MLTLESCLRLPASVAFHSLGSSAQTVIVSFDSGTLFTCNRTTHAFLEAVDGRRTMKQIVDSLGERFEVDRGRLQADMLALAEKLIAEGLLTTDGA